MSLHSGSHTTCQVLQGCSHLQNFPFKRIKESGLSWQLAGHSLLQLLVLDAGCTHGATSPCAQEKLLHFKTQVINLGLQGCGIGQRHQAFHRALDRHGMKVVLEAEKNIQVLEKKSTFEVKIAISVHILLQAFNRSPTEIKPLKTDSLWFAGPSWSPSWRVHKTSLKPAKRPDWGWETWAEFPKIIVRLSRS